MIPATHLRKQVSQDKTVGQPEGLNIYSFQTNSLSVLSWCDLILQLKKGDCAKQQEKGFSRMSVFVFFLHVKGISKCQHTNAFYLRVSVHQPQLQWWPPQASQHRVTDCLNAVNINHVFPTHLPSWAPDGICTHQMLQNYNNLHSPLHCTYPAHQTRKKRG